MAEETVVLGKVTSAFGVKGWVKVFSFTQPRHNILQYPTWRIQQDGEWREIVVKNGRQQGKTIAVQLAGIADRNAAEALAGAKIGVTEQQLPELGNDEYYWRDLEGLQVVNTDQQALGEVSHLIETGANDVLVVVDQRVDDEGKRRRQERLIPFTPEAVVDVDLDGRLILVEWDADF